MSRSVAVITFIASTFAIAAPNPASYKPYASATFEAKSGSTVKGDISFARVDGDLYVEAKVENLSPGLHGIHVHEKGDCSAPDASSAGAHYNPLKVEHGGPTSGARHIGDLGNLQAGEDGKAVLKVKMHPLSKKEAGEWKNLIGKSVVVHASADDLKSQPSGNSGDRIACGVIRQAAIVVP